MPSSLESALDLEWKSWDAKGLARTLRPEWQRSGAVVQTNTGPAIDFSSNDYLGLVADPRLAKAASLVLDRDGTGAGASRLIAGDNPEHEKLEAELAAFFGAAAALTFTTGFAANVGIVPALVNKEDVIFADLLNHASLIDGCRLSRAVVHVYPHRDMNALRALLELHRKSHRRALIVTDGLFSMDGDRTPIADLIALARLHDAWTFVDDAHAVGATGASGRGTAEVAGAHGQIDITTGTLGKAFGVAGAFVYGSSALCRHLLNHARSFVYSTAMLPAQAAAARESLRIVAAEPERRARLNSNARLLRTELGKRGIAVTGEPDSHIVPVVANAPAGTMAIAAALRKQGLLVGAVRPPTVPDGSSRLRISVSAAHTEQQIATCVAAVAAALIA